MTNASQAWDAFAAREPFFAVLPQAPYRRANLTPDGERAFFATGEARVEWIFRMIDPLVPDFAPLAILDYGCGLGRLTLPLAWRARVVTGVDRSPALLTHGRAAAAERGATNIDFVSAEAFAASTRRYDLVVCHGLLQRLRPAEGLALVDDLLRRVSPGGVAVVHFPYASRVPAFVRWSRALRERIPAVNALANRLRGKPADEPFIPTHAYEFGDVSARVERASPEATLFFPAYTDDPPSATILTRVSILAPVPDAASADESIAGDAASGDAPPIDVRDVIARTSIEELNRAAEGYFSTLTDWTHHLAKPFARPEDVPPILMDAAVVLQGLDLSPGLRVLEFGAGSGWLSRWLTQLGCQTTLLDVSPTALAIARELFARQPVVGERPAPVFLHFDGTRIDLPDASVDRIVCFHAFHHAPNPAEIIREFGRVLAPGGIAGFAEPGPRHSRSPLSQFEMRAYAVVENDVDIHAVRDAALSAGFISVTLAVSHSLPFHVSIDEFEDLLTGGPSMGRWAASTRACLRNARTFFLTKSGGSPSDSRTANGLACRIAAVPPGGPIAPGRPAAIDLTVTNSGRSRWLPFGGLGGVGIGAHLHDATGGLVSFDFHSEPLVHPAREIAVGETVRTRMTIPPLAAGRYLLEIDCVAGGVTWFAQQGSRPVRLALDVRTTSEVV